MNHVKSVIEESKDKLVTRTEGVERLQGFIQGLSEVINFVENDE